MKQLVAEKSHSSRETISVGVPSLQKADLQKAALPSSHPVFKYFASEVIIWPESRKLQNIKIPLPWALQLHRASHSAERGLVLQIHSGLASCCVRCRLLSPSLLLSISFLQLPESASSIIGSTSPCCLSLGRSPGTLYKPSNTPQPACRAFAWHDRVLLSTQCSSSEKAINLFPAFLVGAPGSVDSSFGGLLLGGLPTVREDKT